MQSQFGNKIRQLREQQSLFLRQVAPLLEIDTPLLSKIERGEKIVKKEMVSKLADIFRTDKDELLILWLADQVYNVVKDEDVAGEALKSVSKKIKTNRK